MKTNAFLVLILMANAGRALEPPALTNAVDYVLANVLGSLHACNEIMEGAIERHGWTQKDCSDILVAAERALKASGQPGDSYRRQNAVSLLGRHGGTNAIPDLVFIMRNEGEIFKEYAGRGYLRIAASNPFPEWETPLREEIARSPAHAGSFAWTIYDSVSLELEYGGPSLAYQRNLLRFLLGQAAVERAECAMLDEILCREVPRWRASPQRAENAARIIRDHPNDARLVSFFETVRTNALESAWAASRASPDATPAPARDVPANAASDPWADLLSDLPEKKLWTPPPGEDGNLSRIQVREGSGNRPKK